VFFAGIVSVRAKLAFVSHRDRILNWNWFGLVVSYAHEESEVAPVIEWAPLDESNAVT